MKKINTVCVDCLNEACKDTKKYKGYIPKWNIVYSSYTYVCDVCGQEKECTEHSDAGYPILEYVILRIRTKKIKKILTM